MAEDRSADVPDDDAAAQVRALLAQYGTQPEPLPDDWDALVTRSLDQARSSDSAAATPRTETPPSIDDDAPAVPAQRTGPRTRRLFALAASAALLAGGGYLISRGGSGSAMSSAGSAAGSSAADSSATAERGAGASIASQPEPSAVTATAQASAATEQLISVSYPVLNTGTAFTAANAVTLGRGFANRIDAGPTMKNGAINRTCDLAFKRAVGPGGTVIAADQGTFELTPAVVMVGTTSAGSRTLAVFRPGCPSQVPLTSFHLGSG